MATFICSNCGSVVEALSTGKTLCPRGHPAKRKDSLIRGLMVGAGWGFALFAIFYVWELAAPLHLIGPKAGFLWVAVLACFVFGTMYLLEGVRRYRSPEPINQLASANFGSAISLLAMAFAGLANYL
jgi:hypothetical protein